MRRPAAIAAALLIAVLAAGCGREQQNASETTAAAPTTSTATQLSEAEHNAERDLEDAERNAGGATQSTTTSPAQPPAAPGTTSSRPIAARPAIVQRPIPFGARRREEMRAYARRHYGIDSFRLRDPKVVVEHYTVSDSFQAAYNTFASDTPDVELHELPGTCAHFVVDKDGTIYQLVELTIMCRHTVGLNRTAIGIEQVGRSAREILDRPAQIGAVVRLTAWLRCRYAIGLRDVIGHNESLSSPYHQENVAALRGQTHGDWTRAEMAPVRARVGRYRCPGQAGAKAGRSVSKMPAELS